MVSHADPGYGDPNAPKGSPEWAKRWRLCFQGVADMLPGNAKSCADFFTLGSEFRAWTLVGDVDGKPFADFDAFCSFRKPYGLGQDPVKFRAFLAAEIGERAAELATVAPGKQGERSDLTPEETSRNHCGKSEGCSGRKQENLRAILRAPEVVQELYRDGLVSQTTAAMMGPAEPDAEKAVRIVEARQAIGEIPQTEDRRAYRRQVDDTIRRAMGRPKPTPLEKLQADYGRLNRDDRERFLDWANQRGA